MVKSEYCEKGPLLPSGSGYEPIDGKACTDKSTTANPNIDTNINDVGNRKQLNLAPLDGLRGLSSVLIALGHILAFWTRGKHDIIKDIDGNQHSAYLVPVFALEFMTPVSLFFLISGFTLVHVYDRPGSAANNYEDPLSTWPARRLFFRKRIARLAPMYYLGLLIGLAPLLVYNNLQQIYINLPVGLLWLQSLSVPFGLEWNGPLWTVSAFAICYLFFPTTLCRLRSRSLKALSWLTVITAVLSVGMPVLWLWFVPFPAFLYCHFSMLFRFPQFVLGMLAGLLAKRLKSRTGYYYTTLMAEFCMVALVVNFILCALLVQSAPISNAIPLATGKYMFYAEYLLSPVLFMWILALTNPDSSGVTKWLLSSWPCRQLGKVSYSMYCLHFPLLNWIAWAAAGKGLTADSVPIQQNFGWYYFELWAAVPVLLIVLALSSLAYWLVESRARRALTPASANTVIQQYISS